MEQQLEIEDIDSSLYAEAMLTASNYLGCPTPSCSTPATKLEDYVSSLFRDKKDQVMQRAQLSSKFNLVVVLCEAIICPEVNLFKGDQFYFEVRSHGEEHQTSECVKASPNPTWTDHLVTSYHDVTIEIFIKRFKKSTQSIGKAKIPTASIPCSTESFWWFMSCGMTSSRHVCGCMRVRCHFVPLDPEILPDLYQKQMLLCQKCFQFQLSRSGGKLLDVSPSQDIFLPFRSMKQIFDDETVSLLHQYAIQNGMTTWETIICSFIVVNKFFVDTNKVNITAIYLLIKDIITMGSWPQRPLDSALMVRLVKELIPTVKKCSEWLCKMPSELRKSDSQASQLQLRADLLFLIDKFFEERVLLNTIKKIKTQTIFNCKEIFTHSGNQGDQSETSDMDNKFDDTYEMLVMADNILEKSWGKTYLSIIYENFDREIANVIREMLESENKELKDKLLIGAEKLAKYIKKSVPHIFDDALELEKLEIPIEMQEGNF